MKRSLGAGLSVVLGGFSLVAGGREFQPNRGYVPTPFTVGDRNVVPIDIEHIELKIEMDVAAKTAKGHAWINFKQDRPGHAMLDLIPNPTAISLDGKSLGANGLPTEMAPQNGSTVRTVAQATQAGSHLLEIEYILGKTNLAFSDTGARMGWWMDDLDTDRGYLEQYAPSNLEFDPFEMDLQLNLTGTEKSHRLFSNGRMSKFAANQWRVSFPSYFTTSSFYLHLTDADYSVQEFNYQGLEATIPLTIYAESASDASRAMTDAKKFMAELEATFGPFAHSSFTAYITPGGGGMEHCGGTMTSLWALGHEMTHSWFARGVMPANGNAGWIDEAIASWRDDGYPRPNGWSNRPPVNLAAFVEYRRRTPMAAYSYGADFISELDYAFRDQGGMKTVLKDLFSSHKRTPISTPEFATFLQNKTSESLTQYFDRYVYGKSRNGEALLTDAPERASHHPRPYTKAELARYL